MKNKFIKKYLTIETKFDSDNFEDRQKFENACKILEEENFDFEVGTKRHATKYLKRLYFSYSLTTDFILWIVLPLLALYWFI